MTNHLLTTEHGPIAPDATIHRPIHANAGRDSIHAKHRGINIDAIGRGERTRHIAPVGRSADWVLPDGTMIAADVDVASMTDAQLERMATSALALAFPGETHTIGYRFDAKMQIVTTDDLTASAKGSSVVHSYLADAYDADTLDMVREAHADGSDMVVRPLSAADTIGALTEDRGRYSKQGKVAKQRVRIRGHEMHRAGDPGTVVTYRNDEGKTRSVRYVPDHGTQRHVVIVGERVAVGHVWSDRPMSKNGREAQAKKERDAMRTHYDHASTDDAASTARSVFGTLKIDRPVTIRTTNGNVRVSMALDNRVTIASTIPNTTARKWARSVDAATQHLTSILSV